MPGDRPPASELVIAVANEREDPCRPVLCCVCQVSKDPPAIIKLERIRTICEPHFRVGLGWRCLPEHTYKLPFAVVGVCCGSVEQRLVRPRVPPRAVAALLRGRKDAVNLAIRPLTTSVSRACEQQEQVCTVTALPLPSPLPARHITSASTSPSRQHHVSINIAMIGNKQRLNDKRGLDMTCCSCWTHHKGGRECYVAGSAYTLTHAAVGSPMLAPAGIDGGIMAFWGRYWFISVTLHVTFPVGEPASTQPCGGSHVI